MCYDAKKVCFTVILKLSLWLWLSLQTPCALTPLSQPVIPRPAPPAVCCVMQ